MRHAGGLALDERSFRGRSPGTFWTGGTNGGKSPLDSGQQFAGGLKLRHKLVCPACERFLLIDTLNLGCEDHNGEARECRPELRKNLHAADVGKRNVENDSVRPEILYGGESSFSLVDNADKVASGGKDLGDHLLD